jgi:hypothetical protein
MIDLGIEGASHKVNQYDQIPYIPVHRKTGKHFINSGCCRQVLPKKYWSSSSEISCKNGMIEARCKMKVICNSHAMALMHDNKAISNGPNLIFLFHINNRIL